eukprot:Blabericola_migrator_1__3503@NODE_203_length_11435_cov_141_633445_g174_i0_p1_GENE_NODE_203_length_11435_cov_141_633445_g174_i0NODE_203_length_11435_cov_141_633445_g174_i0_p1_ORF_typecomplete_len885_score148_01PIPLCX/PF00388_19/3_2e55PIPLCY/PF00387_19/3_6e34Mcp5_PH/PF12814_7/1_6e10C2/PF00168_30/3_5e07PH_12/PF16457_5/8_8e06EFhand_7/PF13499_6/0_018EFhand_7/PF13499_6/0_00087EFhand_7/PF13499_6/1_5e02EFhand_10/PF14788_6/5e05EFhand_like/PF09279_11/29EFhand_like/PF09279_11/0_019EFhand_8/PF13833_6/0_063E
MTIVVTGPCDAYSGGTSTCDTPLERKKKKSSVYKSSPCIKRSSRLRYLQTLQYGRRSRRLSVDLGLVVISDPIKEQIRQIDAPKALTKVQLGSYLKKYCQKRFKSPHDRFFQIDMDYFVLRWISPNKNALQSQIFLADISRIVPGVDSDFWRGARGLERKLGIEILSSTRVLRLVCPDAETWNLWFTGLLFAHQRAMEAQRQQGGSMTLQYIKHQWDLTDQNHDGKIQLSEFMTFLKRMKLGCDMSYARELFDECRSPLREPGDDNDYLTFDEFKIVIQRLLTHANIMMFFTHYHDPETRLMRADDLDLFIREVQNETGLDDITSDVIDSFLEPFKDGKSGGLTDLGFNLLLTQEKCNSIFDPRKQTVYQDMTLPFASYYIASSHNTYLTSDQIVGKSAVGQYIDVLLKGCRCVELDCWDGNDGDPIIYHGHTLTSKIPFEAVVRACRDYGFKASPYPIIFSLEMHCSARQKKRIGEILNEVLGSMLYTVPEGKIEVPSPEDLKYKILVKGKVPDWTGKQEEEEGNEEDLNMEEMEIKQDLLEEFPCAYCLDVELGSALITSSMTSNRSFLPKPHMNEGVDLSIYYGAISLPGKKLSSFQDPSRHQMHVCSINEKKFDKYLKMSKAGTGRQLVAFHRQFMSRIYPAGTRLMSSNYNPLPCWNVGCQMVALNYQGIGLSTLMNLGRFLDNGNCGYVLKPSVISDPVSTLDPFSIDRNILMEIGEQPMTLTLYVLAGQQLPRTYGQYEETASYINPYVVVSVQGVDKDCYTLRTGVVIGNGLNPCWAPKPMEFRVTVPSLALLVFEVRHSEAMRSEYLAGYSLPLTCMRTGLRWVPLYDTRLRKMHHTGLLVYVSTGAATGTPSRHILRQPIDGVTPTAEFLSAPF